MVGPSRRSPRLRRPPPGRPRPGCRRCSAGNGHRSSHPRPNSGTSNVIVLLPATTGTRSAICSSGPPHEPSPLKSIQASSLAEPPCTLTVSRRPDLADPDRAERHAVFIVGAARGVVPVGTRRVHAVGFHIAVRPERWTGDEVFGPVLGQQRRIGKRRVAEVRSHILVPGDLVVRVGRGEDVDVAVAVHVRRIYAEGPVRGGADGVGA